MAKAYVCDACGITISNPYEVKMKEFYVGCSFEYHNVFPSFDKRRINVHLCDDCYHALCEIAENKRGMAEDGK